MQRLVTSKYILSLFILFTIIILLYDPLFQEVFALSPSFARQGIEDAASDWSLATKNIASSLSLNKTETIAECRRGLEYFLSPDIVGVNYFSDGETLNATIWLSLSFEEPASNKPPFFHIGRSYGWLIDINSAYDTRQGPDYKVIINWDILNHRWTRTVEEWSSTPGEDKIFGSEESMILDQEDNYTGFYQKGKNYVDLSLNLSEVSSPDQYSMSFYVLDYFKTEVGFCTIEDITDLVHIPPPEFVMSASPSSATLRSGDEENVQLQLKSTGKLNSHLVLSTNRIDDNIETNFMPKQISVPHSGMATSRLHVKVLENASIGTHTIPIVANISFPTILENRFSSEIFNNPTSVNIFEYSNFTITVLSPFTFGEQLDNFYKAWLSPISGLWTFLAGVAAVIAPLVIRLYSKRQNKGKYKKLSDWFNREK
jgi:hypothetical protein